MTRRDLRNALPLVVFGVLTLILPNCSTAETKRLEVGQPAPSFTLPTHEGKDVKLEDYRGKFVVLEWFNIGCPYVRKHYNNGDMQALQQDLISKDVVWLTINSTHPGHRDALTADETKTLIAEKKIASTAMLVDADGNVGKLYHAKTTPHMFVIDREGKIAYEGAIDADSDVFSNPKKSQNYVREVATNLIEGKPVVTSQTKPYGCSIKYAS